MLDSILHNPKDKIDFIIAMVVILLAGFFIIYYSLESEKNPQQGELSPDLHLADSMVIDGTLYVPFPPSNTEDRLNVIGASPDVVASHENDSYVVHSSYMNSEDSISTGNIVLDSLASIEREIDSSVMDIDTLSMSQGQVFINDSIQEIEERVSEAIQSETQKQSEDPRSCVIVIGAYGNEDNKNNLIARLEGDGYDVFQVPYKGLTRIGVYMSCSSEKIESELSMIRIKYAADAVVLTKQALN